MYQSSLTFTFYLTLLAGERLLLDYTLNGLDILLYLLLEIAQICLDTLEMI